MSCCRQIASIWFYIKWHYQASTGKKPECYNSLYEDLMFCFKSHYFWHDSFGKFINRWFICPLIGHKNVQYVERFDVELDKEIQVKYCFKCEKYI